MEQVREITKADHNGPAGDLLGVATDASYRESILRRAYEIAPD